MDSELKDKETTYTRGKVLKRAGVGAAALWTVPMFISTEGAFAAVSGKACVKYALDGSPRAGLGPCDWGDAPARPCPCHMGGFVGPPCDAGGNGACFCFSDLKGCPQCRDTSQLGNACTSNRQCPTGWKCVYTCLDACPGGVGCCDTCTGNSAPSSGPSGKGLVCLPPCNVSSGGGGLSATALKLAKAGG